MVNGTIVPLPYEKVEVDGRRAILHQPFNALLPGRYTNEDDRERDLATLLVGQTLSGEGDIVFAGQAMSLRQSLAPNLLPPCPVLKELQALPSTNSETLFSHLSKLTYEPGFTPLSKEWFDRIKTLEFEWAAFNTRIKSLIYSNLQLIWSRTEEIDWAQWNETVTGEEAREDLRQLRYYYPELNALPDGALYSLFDTYQMDCKFINGWTAYREDEFFFFLLGQLSVPRNTYGQHIVPVGEFVGYELLRGQLSSVAVEAGKVWFAYNEAIYNLAYRVSQIVEFLRSPSDVKRGRPIFIFEDWFAMCRTTGSFSITLQQSFETLQQSFENLS
ncbi:MAG: hypothetical protein HC784_12325 [Hydrococcus sp. CSU_1_8]|nr:hypothetical protein [Hydrococcus sp. CSU_1_8]